MHHWGEGAVSVQETTHGYTVLLENHATGAKIEVSLPLYGFFIAPERRLDPDTAHQVGDAVAHYLRDNYD